MTRLESMQRANLPRAQRIDASRDGRTLPAMMASRRLQRTGGKWRTRVARRKTSDIRCRRSFLRASQGASRSLLGDPLSALVPSFAASGASLALETLLGVGWSLLDRDAGADLRLLREALQHAQRALQAWGSELDAVANSQDEARLRGLRTGLQGLEDLQRDATRCPPDELGLRVVALSLVMLSHLEHGTSRPLTKPVFAQKLHAKLI